MLALCLAAPQLVAGPAGWAEVDQIELVTVDRQARHADPAASPPDCTAFSPHQGEVNLGLSSATAWLRFRPGTAGADQRLLLRFGGLSQVCAHWPLSSGGYQVDCAPNRGVRRVRQGFLLTPPETLDMEREAFVAARSKLWLKLPLEYGSADALAETEHAGQLYWGLYFGVLMGFALLGAVVFAGQRDVMYLYFAAHVACLGLALALWQGRFTAGLGAGSIAIAPALIGLSLAAGALFYRDFLGTGGAAPKTHAGFGWLAGLASGCALLSLLAPQSGSSLLGLTALAWIGLAVFTALQRAWKGSRSARTMLLGLSLLLLALLVNAFQVLGWPLLGARRTNLLLYLGVLSSALFLVLAIAQRVRLLALERDRANRLLLRLDRQLAGAQLPMELQEHLERRLPVALGAGQLALHYQPLLDVQSGELLGAEALLRWPELEVPQIGPQALVEAAAQCGQSDTLTDWILRSALQQMSRWDEAGLPAIRVSVNLGADEFHQPELPQRIARALQDCAMPASRLALEITEHTLIHDLAQARRTIREIRDLGVGVWVDDFGAGYSSFNYLRTLPVSGIKLDRVFMQGFPEQAAALTLVRALLALARDLGLQVVVEGVENASQQDCLRAHGGVAVQGYFHARPMAAVDFQAWVQRRAQQAA